MTENERIMQAAAAVMEQPVLYIMIDKTTNMPFIDDEKAIFIFSCKEFADECVDYYAQQQKMWYVGEIAKEQVTPFLGAVFYYAGAEKAVLDNGQNFCIIPAELLVEKPDTTGMPKEAIPVTNPDFFAALLIFTEEYQWQLNYPEKSRIIKEKQKELIKSFGKARFLVPVQGTQGTEEQTTDKTAAQEGLKAGMQIALGCITGSNGLTATPAFTDWGEFDKVYGRDEWEGLVLKADELATLPLDNVIINLGSVAFVMSKNMINTMLEVYLEELADEA